MIRESEYLPYRNLSVTVSEDQRQSTCICGEIRAPGSISSIGPGVFFAPDRTFIRRKQMNRKELAFAKQAILSTKDWDAYQAMIRKCLRVSEKDFKLEGQPANRKS